MSAIDGVTTSENYVWQNYTYRLNIGQKVCEYDGPLPIGYFLNSGNDMLSEKMNDELILFV